MRRPRSLTLAALAVLAALLAPHASAATAPDAAVPSRKLAPGGATAPPKEPAVPPAGAASVTSTLTAEGAANTTRALGGTGRRGERGSH